jgi:pyruvate formate lyase activating enzyme
MQTASIASDGVPAVATTVSLGLSRRSCLGVIEENVVPGTAQLSAELRHLELEALRTGAVASVHSWELVTAVDGPGTRMTLFLSGCPLRCQYCQNPDTWQMRDGLITGIDEIVARISRYRDLFRITKGGVTVSGGEPLMQSAFLQRLFEECRRLGVHTALDTSGFLGGHASEQLLSDTNLVLLDVKSGIEETYQDVTGRSLQPTREFGDRLARLGTPVWIRFVLVPGLTDAVDNVDAVAEIVSHWANVERVEVLPFHQMGRSKWEKLGLDYQLDGVLPPSRELQERVRGQFRAYGLTVF